MFHVNPDSIYFKEFEDALPRQDGKVVVITGTTSGTGYVAAQTTIRKGATAVMLNRKSSRAEKAVEKLEKEFPNDKEKIVWIPCDLQDFESVSNAAKEIKAKFPDGVHVLCNNAGIMAVKDKATKDGYDVQIQTNHLSHFMLTRDLLPLLEKASQRGEDARIVNHSSSARFLPFLPLHKDYFEKRGGNLGGDGATFMFGGRWRRYHQSKLANSVFTLELVNRFSKSGSKIRSFCAHPGNCATELQATSAKDGGFNMTSALEYAQSAEDGSMGILRGMFSNDVENGALYGPRIGTGPATKRWHGILSSAAAGKMLWEQSEKACGQFKI